MVLSIELSKETAFQGSGPVPVSTNWYSGRAAAEFVVATGKSATGSVVPTITMFATSAARGNFTRILWGSPHQSFRRAP